MEYDNADIDPYEALTVKQVAERLHVSRPTVMKSIKAGDLPSVIFGGCRRVLRSDLEDFLFRRRSYGFCSTREPLAPPRDPDVPPTDEHGEITF